MFISNLLHLILLLAAACLSLAQFPERGLPYNDPPVSIESQNWNRPGSQINWAYNWGSNMDPNFPEFLEYIPMLWGDAPVHTDSVSSSSPFYSSISIPSIAAHFST